MEEALVKALEVLEQRRDALQQAIDAMRAVAGEGGAPAPLRPHNVAHGPAADEQAVADRIPGRRRAAKKSTKSKSEGVEASAREAVLSALVNMGHKRKHVEPILKKLLMESPDGDFNGLLREAQRLLTRMFFQPARAAVPATGNGGGTPPTLMQELMSGTAAAIRGMGPENALVCYAQMHGGRVIVEEAIPELKAAGVFSGNARAVRLKAINALEGCERFTLLPEPMNGQPVYELGG